MLLAGLALLPAFVFLLYQSFAQRQHVASDARKDALRLVQLAAAEQRQMVAMARQQLLMLAQLPIVQRPDWTALCNRTFADLLKQNPTYANLGVIDRGGDVRCSAVPMKQRVNVSDRDYFRAAMATGTFAVGAFQTGRITGRSTVVFAQPMPDAAGEIQGMVFIAMDLLAWLDQLAAGTLLPPGTALLLLNRQGTVLARHPDPERWMGRTLPDSPLIRAVLTRDGGGSIVATGLDGVPRLQVYDEIGPSPAAQVYFVAGIPTREVLAHVNQELFGSLLVLAAVAVMTLALAWLGSTRLILQPTATLLRAVQRLARDDLSARTHLPRVGGEIGELARNFDRMAENLQHKHHELQRVNRALKILSAGNRAMLRATDEQSLLEDMCRVIVREGGYAAALVLYRRDDDAGTLWPMAEAGYPGGLAALRALPISWADNDYGQGSAGIAVRTGQTRVTRNALKDPNYDVWHAVAPAYPSDASMPLRVGGEIIGVLTITASEPNAFQAEELKMLEESADDLAFGVGSLRTRAAHQQASEALWRMTHFDAITALPNETHFTERLAAAIDDAERRNRPFALLQLDIERLREINDALGFGNGNELLRQFGERLRYALPDPAVTARLRADEFAVLLPDTGTDAAIDAALRLRSELTKPFEIADIPLDVPLQIGIALFPEHGATPHDLFRHMDMALQQAKKKIGAGHAVFDTSLNHIQPRRLTMASELRRAIDGGDLLLYLQPKVEMASGRVCGAEGLVRWRHAAHGLIPPGEFIGLAEHTGLIKPLTEWVIEAALRLNHAWLREGCALPIAVNLSARNLHEEMLLDKIRGLLATWGTNTGLLNLEITESTIMNDPGFALGVLRRLSDAGISLHIDDFGTGYSSLSYLQKLPVDTIKIDRSFVTDIVTNRDSELIVRSTIGLAHDLGRKVIAEGVEDRETWSRLAALGCDMAQGYFIAKPMPAEQFPAWVREFRPPVAGG
jgi:diguanylate cyclase (GGDEF)-like protein